jgi:hypothetical protein
LGAVDDYLDHGGRVDVERSLKRAKH